MSFRFLSPCLLFLALVLVGCGDDRSASQPDVQTAANGDEYNDADVEFASGMIQHHAQALAMVDLTLGRRLDPAVQQLVEQIRTTQVAEIETMTGWLSDWEEPVPETVRDHANAHGDGHADQDGPGMVSGDALDELEAARGAAFQELWLETMAGHHEGSLAMAAAEQDEGRFGPAVELSASIERTQAAEIDRMRKLGS